MAADSLLDALGAGGDGDKYDDTYVPATAIRITRHPARKGSEASTATSEVQKTRFQPRRSLRNDSASPALFKRQKGALSDIASPTVPFPTYQETEASAVSHSATQAIGPAITSEGIITNSSNDDTIADTMARMQRYVEDRDLFVKVSAANRRNIVKGLKSSYGNRYNGRCTETEGRQYIELWVQLADAHNGLCASDMERKSLGVRVNPKLRTQDDDGDVSK